MVSDEANESSAFRATDESMAALWCFLDGVYWRPILHNTDR